MSSGKTATLLMKAGITSLASIKYRDEDLVLDKYKKKGEEVDYIYMKRILPDKMKYNLQSIKDFSFGSDILTMFRTVAAVLGKDYE